MVIIQFGIRERWYTSYTVQVWNSYTPHSGITTFVASPPPLSPHKHGSYSLKKIFIFLPLAANSVLWGKAGVTNYVSSIADCRVGGGGGGGGRERERTFYFWHCNQTSLTSRKSTSITAFWWKCCRSIIATKFRQGCRHHSAERSLLDHQNTELICIFNTMSNCLGCSIQRHAQERYYARQSTISHRQWQLPNWGTNRSNTWATYHSPGWPSTEQNFCGVQVPERNVDLFREGTGIHEVPRRGLTVATAVPSITSKILSYNSPEWLFRFVFGRRGTASHNKYITWHTLHSVMHFTALNYSWKDRIL